MTDQEINEAVARKLGYTDKEFWTDPEFDYCHDIKAAWEIVEKIHNQILFTLWWHDGEWECDIEMSQGAFKTNADTAPMAICLAFLKLQEKS